MPHLAYIYRYVLSRAMCVCPPVLLPHCIIASPSPLSCCIPACNVVQQCAYDVLTHAARSCYTWECGNRYRSEEQGVTHADVAE